MAMSASTNYATACPPGEGTNEYFDESSGSITYGGYLAHLVVCRSLKKGPALQSGLIWFGAQDTRQAPFL
jgi:hypothetical protein